MRRPLVVRRVVGQSMNPGLQEGQVIVATSFRRLKPGRIVVARLEGREVIKRVETIDRDFCNLVSDDPRGENYTKIAKKRIIATTL